MNETEILVGYVNKFVFNDKVAEDVMNGHPTKGRIYQVIKDPFYGYRIHIGAENTKENKMAGVLLGESLVGQHGDKWEFDVEILNEENFLDFDLEEEDAHKIHEWFSTGNKNLKETLEKPVKIITSEENGTLKVHDLSQNTIEKVDPSVIEEAQLSQVTQALNKVMEEDKEFFFVLSQLLMFLGSCYSSGYLKNKGVNSIDYLLSSDSCDPAIFAAVDSLQQYSDKTHPNFNNVAKLYQAIDFLMLEIQRQHRHNG